MKQMRFTLIELLFVVSVMMIIMSILLPALNVGRSLSKRIACAANLRQISIAAFGYVGDNNDYLPLATITNNYFYGRTLGPYLGYDCSSYKGYDYGDVYSKRVFLCKEELKNHGSALAHPDYNVITNYMGTIGGGIKEESTVPSGAYGGWQRSYCTGICKQLEKVVDNSVVMIEMYAYDVWGANGLGPTSYAQPGSTNSQYYPTATYSFWSTSYWHNNTANFLFKDGHVKSFKAGTQFNSNWQTSAL